MMLNWMQLYMGMEGSKEIVTKLHCALNLHQINEKDELNQSYEMKTNVANKS